MNPEEFLSKIQDNKSESNRSLIVEYLSWIFGKRYIPGVQYIVAPCNRLLEEMEKKYSYELERGLESYKD